MVKKSVLDDLIDTYEKTGDVDKAVGAASRLLQLDPNNMKALYVSATIKRSQCLRTNDAAGLRRCRSNRPEGPQGHQAH